MQDSAKLRSVRDGVYNAGQAQRGKLQYEKSCASCHGVDLAGNSLDGYPALAGEVFIARWQGRTVADLFATRKAMPQNQPGSLDPKTYVDVIAYVLESNDCAAGKEDLNASDDILKSILIKN